MRSIREYIRKTLFDSSSILPAYRLDAPQRVKDFAFVRAPVERLADVLSRGFVLPDKDHVYSLNSQWRVADCSRGVPFAHINEARREFPPAVEAHALHGAYDAFEIYSNVAPSDSGMKSYVQLASFWRGNGGAGFDVSIMPDTCFEAFVFLEAVRGRAYCRKASASAGATWRAIINRGSRCSCPIRIWYGVPPPILNSGLECVS